MHEIPGRIHWHEPTGTQRAGFGTFKRPALPYDKFMEAEGIPVFPEDKLEELRKQWRQAQPPAESPDEEYPLRLTTGRTVAHYLSGNQTRRIPALVEQTPRPWVEVHPSLGFTDDDPVRIVTRRGAVTLPALVTETIRPDTIFVPYHWAAPVAANILIIDILYGVNALPTAVAGLVYAGLYVENGWFGKYLVPLGIEGAYSRLGIVLVLIFIGLPFVVRAVQPILEDMEPESEEASASLGATRWQTFRHVVLPTLRPALITGFALAFARGVGEYGSVVFISGNMPMRTEIAPLLIITKLEQFDYAGATAIAVVMLTLPFAMLLAINALQGWTTRRVAG